MANGRIKISEMPESPGIQNGDVFPVTQLNVVDQVTGQQGVTSKVKSEQIA
jgi:hypothetical protein